VVDQRAFGCSVEVAENLERFDELVVLLPLVERGAIEEDVVDPVLLAGARRPGGSRYGQPRPGLPVEEFRSDGALAGSGRAREDEENAQGRLAFEVVEEGAPLMRPRTRRFSLISSSSIVRRAFTLPTPGRDSRTVTTLSLATASSVSPCASNSPRLIDPALSFSFSSARWRRAAAAFSRAAWRCAGSSCGGRGIAVGPPEASTKTFVRCRAVTSVGVAARGPTNPVSIGRASGATTRP
jgi:hypothetical protein